MLEPSILLLTPDPSVARTIWEGIQRFANQTRVDTVSSHHEAIRRASSGSIVGLVIDAEFCIADIEFVRDFQTALPAAPVLLVSASPKACAPLISGSPLVQFLPKPIPERELQMALVSLLFPHGIHRGNRGLEAYLSGLLLADVIQLMFNSGISGHLVVSSADGKIGDIEMRNGQIVAAMFPGATGARAVAEMFHVDAGQVVQHPPRPNIEQNVFIPTNHLLIKAASTLDESRQAATDLAQEVRQETLSIESLDREFRDMPKLLVVEDNEFLLSYLELLLGEAFPRVVVIGVPKGADGLAAVRVGMPHAVILDRHLGDMKGEDFCQQMRTIPGAEMTPVLLISGDLPSEVEKSKSFVGPTWFLEKPFQAPLLVETLAAMLGVPLDPA